MSKGGSGGSSQTTEFQAPLWTRMQWPDLVQAGTSLYTQPQQEYGGQRIAGINNTQAQGMQHLADLSGNTSPDMAAARNMLQMTAMGGIENPYSTLQTQNGHTFLPDANDPNNWNRYIGEKANGGDYGGIMGKFDAKVNGGDYGGVMGQFDAKINGGDYGGIMGQFGDKVNGGDYGSIMGQFGGQVNGGNYDFNSQNKWADKTTNAGQNAFKGFGPQYEALQNRAIDKFTKAYQTGTQAQTNSAYNRIGAFGAGAHNAQVNANQQGFGEGLGNLIEQMDMSQWTNSGNLEGQDLSRSTQAQLADFARNASTNNAGQQLAVQAQLGDMGRNYQYTNAGLDRSMQAQLGDMGRNNQLYAGGLDRSVQAQNMDLNRGAQYTSAGLDRGVQAQISDLNRDAQYTNAGLDRGVNAQQQDMGRNSKLMQEMLGLKFNQGNTANQLAFQAQTNDYNRAAQQWDSERNRQFGSINPILAANQFEQNNARNLIGIGDIQRGYTQDNMNMEFGNWQGRQNYPGQMIDAYGNLLSRASGNYGTNTTINNQQMYQANPFANAVGAGLTAASLYGAMK